MKKIAILQPCYIPWKGLFDMINRVDIFVFLENVQYTKRDWRSRNKIKTQKGTEWITVPVITKGMREQLVCEAEIDNSTDWQRKHYQMIYQNYSKAKFFKEYRWILEEIYLKKTWSKISELDIEVTKLISKVLGIKTEFRSSLEIETKGVKEERIIEICKEMRAEGYLSGPAAKDYIVNENFSKNGIFLEYIDYDYKEYKQLYEPFDHYVTVLDVIFNCGEEAGKYIFSQIVKK